MAARSCCHTGPLLDMGAAVGRIPPTGAIRQRIRASWIFLFLRLVQLSFFIFNKFHWPLIRTPLSWLMLILAE
jgi:hypothetical protein